MAQYYRIISITLIFLLAMNNYNFSQSYLQPKNTEKKLIKNFTGFNKLNIYQKDFLIYVNLLNDVHPALVDSAIVSDSYIKEVLFKLEKNNNLFNLRIQMQKVAALLHDSHTFVDLSKTDSIFPVRAVFFNGKYYIYRISKNHEPHNGKAIKSINGHLINDVENLFKSILSYENDVKLQNILNFTMLNYKYLRYFKIINCDTLTLGFEDSSYINLNLKKNSEIEWSAYYVKKNHEITKRKRNKLFFYKIFESEKICYFQFNSFYDKSTYNYFINENLNWFQRLTNKKEINEKLYKLPNFNIFLDSMFNDIDSNNIQTLVVDLRYNSGGNSVLGNQLLAYLDSTNRIMKEHSVKIRLSEFYRMHYKKTYKVIKRQLGRKNQTIKSNYLYTDEELEFSTPDEYNLYGKYFKIPKVNNTFKGNVLFIQGSRTFSSASMLIEKLYDNKTYTIIGQASSQKPTSFGDILSFELPNTKIKGGISHKYFERPDSSLNHKKTLIPNIIIPYEFSDFVNGKDKVWDFILQKY